jgi:hypothetical protein
MPLWCGAHTEHWKSFLILQYPFTPWATCNTEDVHVKRSQSLWNPCSSLSV